MTMTKTKLPKLTDIIPINLRPHCFYCGKRLQPRTSEVIDAREGEHDTPPELGETHAVGSIALTEKEYMPHRVYRRRAVLGSIRWKYWTGKFRGYFRDQQGVTMFCTTECAQRFGAAAVRGGYRMPEGENER